jgi:hypothetical protein
VLTMIAASRAPRAGREYPRMPRCLLMVMRQTSGFGLKNPDRKG